jgi:hypothetical protein
MQEKNLMNLTFSQNWAHKWRSKTFSQVETNLELSLSSIYTFPNHLILLLTLGTRIVIFIKLPMKSTSCLDYHVMYMKNHMR